MSDPVSTARSARESLARALSALQSDPSIPGEVGAVAEPISQTMSALFQIERSGGSTVPTHGPAALESVRRALALLQRLASVHPAVQAAMEGVAGSLGLVHGLAAPNAPPLSMARPVPQPQPGFVHAPAPAEPVSSATFAYAPPPSQAHPPAFAAPAPTPAPAPIAAAPAPAGAAPAPVAPRDAVRIEAELGTHSPSNFYRGLSGNDVVEHGGLFVATYNIPRIGQPLALRVSMPGGYEFEALAVVRWIRDTRDSAATFDGVQPGFGAQFTDINAEARQLVQRYVRNREPLFHDDM